MAGPGRETKMTPETVKAICDAIADGVPESHAAVIGGISVRTLRTWMARGKREGKGAYAAFFSRVKRARAKFIQSNIKRIKRAGTERDVTTIKRTIVSGQVTEEVQTTKREHDWGANAWLLERTNPDYFSSTARELREMKKLVNELMQKVASVAAQGTPPTGATSGTPRQLTDGNEPEQHPGPAPG